MGKCQSIRHSLTFVRGLNLALDRATPLNSTLYPLPHIPDPLFPIP